MENKLIPYEEVELKTNLLNYALHDSKVAVVFEPRPNGKQDALVLVKYYDDRTINLAEGFDDIRRVLTEILREHDTQLRILQRLNGLKEWWIV